MQLLTHPCRKGGFYHPKSGGVSESLQEHLPGGVADL